MLACLLQRRMLLGHRNHLCARLLAHRRERCRVLLVRTRATRSSGGTRLEKRHELCSATLWRSAQVASDSIGELSRFGARIGGARAG